ncbi:SDR family NAD(P)-dependent oxidoreductase [Saccharothrix sp. Mg75]|uniref:SDR family NAD(P)-dependent oxidoreductase n=1 Tax=Saccharothrix sp. Mg75 TaxID=3445357 RepID=UPI003EED794E
MGLLDGMVALVTGGSGHVGRGVVRRFAAAGASVVVHGLGGDVGGGVLGVRGDLRDEGECRAVVRAAFGWGGRLDALVNCAGVQPVRELAGMSADEWRSVVDANLTSAFSCTQAAVEVMGAGGSVTHVASVEGSHPARGHAHYSASKAGLIMHARSAALEYGERGIRVNTVSPGLVGRPGIEDAWPDGVRRWTAAAPLTRLGTPEDVGDACVFLASPMASWITGHDLVVDGGVGARPTW